MATRHRCPHCEKLNLVKSSHDSPKFRCTGCDRLFRIDDDGDAGEEEKPAPPKKKSKKKRKPDGLPGWIVPTVVGIGILGLIGIITTVAVIAMKSPSGNPDGVFPAAGGGGGGNLKPGKYGPILDDTVRSMRAVQNAFSQVRDEASMENAAQVMIAETATMRQLTSRMQAAGPPTRGDRNRIQAYQRECDDVKNKIEAATNRQRGEISKVRIGPNTFERFQEAARNYASVGRSFDTAFQIAAGF